MQQQKRTIMSKSLSLITSQFLDVERQLLDTEGVISPELEAALDLSQGELSMKVDAYAHILDKLDATELWAQAQAKAFAALLKKIKSSRDGLYYRLGDAMARMERTELEGERYAFREKLGRGKVEITDLDKIPFEYKRIKTEIEADKRAIYDAIASGVEVEGALIVKEPSIKKEFKL